jgi:uncharacterized Tic20 family protein
VGGDPRTGHGTVPAARGYRQPAYLASPARAPHPGPAAPDAERAGAAHPGLAPWEWPPVTPRPGSRDARLARLGYVTLPLAGFVVPLAVRLTAGRRSPWLREHAAQALNLWLTGILYLLSAAITAAMLALDSPTVAAVVIGPLVALVWLVTLGALARAATAAGRGQRYRLPRWLCSRIVR